MITVNSQGQALTQAYADAVRGDDRVFLARVSMNGTELNGDVVSLSITKGSCGGAEFEVGAVMSNTLNLQMLNLTDNVKGQDLKVEIGLEVNGSMEYITVGYFTATEVKRTHYNTNITGYGYSVSKTGDIMPTVASQVLSDLRNELSSATGVNVTYDPAIDTSLEITKDLAGLTIYQVFQVIASVVGGYVKDDASGAITIKVYDDTPTLSVDAGMMVKLPDAEEYDFTITGVQCTAGETVYQSGTVNVEMENEYMTQDLFADCAPNLIGYSYRPATINLSVGDPRLEGDDVLTVTDIDNTTYVVPCHQITHKYTGGFSSDIESIRATMIENGEATSAPISTQLKQQEKQIARVDRIASNTDQYFWFTSQGTDTGAHITEIPQEDFKARTAVDPTDGGGNLLARSNGIAVRDGLTELATFGTTGIQLGQSGQSTAEINSYSLRMVDKNGTDYLNVEDLRGTRGYVDYTVTTTWEEDQERFYLGQYVDMPETLVVTVNDVVQVADTDYTFEANTVSSNNSDILFINFPATGATVTASFSTGSSAQKAFTFGTRKSGTGTGAMSASFGYENEASDTYAFAEGYRTKASGKNAHAEGQSTQATKNSAHAEGYGTKATAIFAHAEGQSTTASGYYSHAEGQNTQATNNCAHAEGYNTIASGRYAHAEGEWTTASSSDSHAEGSHTTASNAGAHAEGAHTTASGFYSHAGGYYTEANHKSQVAIGEYNALDPSTETAGARGNYALIIGNGTSSTRSNALAVDWNGNLRVRGNLIYGCNTDSTDGTSLSLASRGLTRTSNSYVNATDFARLSCYTFGKLGILFINLHMSTSLPSNSTWVTIGTSSAKPLFDVNAVLPAQTNQSKLLFGLNTAGSLQIWNGSGVDTGGTWFRYAMPFIVA